MEFSEVYKHSKELSAFSPDGKHLATIVKNKLLIRNAESLEILVVFESSDPIDDLNWGGDSDLILTSIFELGKVELRSISDPDWYAVIEDSVLGLKLAKFVPTLAATPEFVLTFSEAQLRVTIWSLTTKKAAYIVNPKYHNKGLSFREDNKYMALLERKDGKDALGIYDTETWFLKKHFFLDTVDAFDIAWSPDGLFLSVWENCTEYKIIVYSPAGFVVSSYCAYPFGLGIKTVIWSPSSQFLALGSYDQKLRLLNTYTWEPTITFSHPSNITAQHTYIFQELNNPTWKESSLDARSSKSSLQPEARFLISRPPIQLQSHRPDPDKPNPKMGIGCCGFNSDGQFIFTINDNMPNSLWIWEIGVSDPVWVVILLKPIKAAAWNPVDPDQLVIVCGSNHIYTWSQSTGFECHEFPSAQFLAHSVKWNSNGLSATIFSKSGFCVGFTTAKD